MALTDIVYVLMGMPSVPIAVIMRSQQKRAARPEKTDSMIFVNLSFLIIKITRITPEITRRLNRRFITSPFNNMK